MSQGKTFYTAHYTKVDECTPLASITPLPHTAGSVCVCLDHPAIPQSLPRNRSNKKDSSTLEALNGETTCETHQLKKIHALDKKHGHSGNRTPDLLNANEACYHCTKRPVVPGMRYHASELCWIYFLLPCSLDTGCGRLLMPLLSNGKVRICKVRLGAHGLIFAFMQM